jgi:hypothetical protein
MPWEHKAGQPTMKLMHYTFIFNIFVFLQVFNLLNMRKLGERQFNIFGNLFNNPLFFVVFILAFSLQIVLIKFGGQAVKTYPLDLNQNLICIAVGSTSLISGVIMRLFPAKCFSCLTFDESEDKEGEREKSSKSFLNAAKSSTLRKSKKEAAQKKKEESSATKKNIVTYE